MKIISKVDNNKIRSLFKELNALNDADLNNRWIKLNIKYFDIGTVFTDDILNLEPLKKSEYYFELKKI